MVGNFKVTLKAPDHMHTWESSGPNFGTYGSVLTSGFRVVVCCVWPRCGSCDLPVRAELYAPQLAQMRPESL